MLVLVVVWLAVTVAAAHDCELQPEPSLQAAPKSPGDNFYRLIINGDVERYAPNQRYVGESTDTGAGLNT